MKTVQYEAHGALKAAYYDAFRAARQEINAGVAGMEVQGGFDPGHRMGRHLWCSSRQENWGAGK